MTRNPAIDGLRALAALLVIVFHSFAPWWLETVPWSVNPGMVGVRLFFVLSGALISGLLWSMQDDGRGFGSTWGRFAFRRALRIFPLAYFAMALAWLVGLPAMREQGWVYLTFTQNLIAPFVQPWPGELLHFWTLAVEEQVYLVWPVILLLIPSSRWPLACAGWIGVSFLSRLVWPILWPSAMWHGPWFYLDAFALGSLIALSARHGHLRLVTRVCAGVGVALVAFAWGYDDTVSMSILETGLVGVTAAVVGFAWHRPTMSVLTCPPIVWIGTLSYGVYVWHALAPHLLETALDLTVPGEGWITLAWKSGLGIGCAALTWYGFERPINRLKDRIGHGHQTPVADPLAV